MLVKAFFTAREIILEELQKLSKAINQTIDISDFTSKHDGINLSAASLKDVRSVNAEVSQVSDKMQNVSQVILYFCSNTYDSFCSLDTCHLLFVFSSFNRNQTALLTLRVTISSPCPRMNYSVFSILLEIKSITYGTCFWSFTGLLSTT